MTEEDNKEEKVVKKKVEVGAAITVSDFSDRSGLAVTQIISQLINNGVLAAINDTIDFETAAIVGDDLGLEVVKEDDSELSIESTTVKKLEKDKSRKLKERPPVVTIMGHVDHGKTTLLDNIRKASVVETESGGITQHISAYQIILKNSKNKKIKNKTITFIDTPGHAAFSALRGHGAAITDIAVLIVAANDGVKPQTVEVVKQAKEQNVPIIVAINKTDLPDADVMKTKQQLGDLDLVSEEWGGKTVMVEVSAKTGSGIDNLLEMILIESEMKELKADFTAPATGIVIDSHMHKGAGALAVVLVENGTLKKSDAIQVGGTWGKVRIMEDYNSDPIEKAPPSFPVRIAGLKSLPEFGDRMVVHDSEKSARLAAQSVEKSMKKSYISTATKLDKKDEEESEVVEIPLVLKTDVKGSLEALKKMLLEIDSELIDLKIVAEGIGPISESDASVARASKAIILGFRVKTLTIARKIAENSGVSIISKDVIYEVVDILKTTVSDMLPLQIIEQPQAKGKILAIFRDDKKGVVIGGKLDEGKAKLDDNIKVLQDKNEKWKGKIVSLRREKNEVKEVEAGQEFGIGLNAGAKVANGDEVVIFKVVEKKRTIK